MSRDSALAQLASMTSQPALTPTTPPTSAVDGVTQATENTENTGTRVPLQDELQSSRLAILAKKEAKIQREREEFQRQREAWLQEKKQADEYLKRGKEFDETRKTDPVAALKMIGFTDAEIMNYLAGQASKADPTPEDIARKAAQEEIEKLKIEQTEAQKKQEEARNERLVTNLKSQISNAIKSEAEKFEYCAFEGPAAEDLAYEIIVETLKESDELITAEEALALAEDYYEMRDKEMTKLRKRQAGQPVEAAVPPTALEINTEKEAPSSMKRGLPPKSNVAPPQRAKPLTNQITANAPSVSAPRRETREEKKERLAEALRRGYL
jgi:hypothetical protein